MQFQLFLWRLPHNVQGGGARENFVLPTLCRGRAGMEGGQKGPWEDFLLWSGVSCRGVQSCPWNKVNKMPRRRPWPNQPAPPAP